MPRRCGSFAPLPAEGNLRLEFLAPRRWNFRGLAAERSGAGRQSILRQALFISMPIKWPLQLRWLRTILRPVSAWEPIGASVRFAMALTGKALRRPIHRWLVCLIG